MYVNLTFKVLWQFKDYPHLKITKCKKVINCKTNKILKYHVRGYFIGNSYIAKKELNNHIEKIQKKEYCPF